MFVPVWDDNPLRSIQFQFVTLVLIAINVAIFLLEASGMSQQAIASFAIVPSELFQVRVLGGPAPISGDAIAVPERYTLLTYMFFHGDIFHLAGNMVFLWVFGDNVEDALGHFKYIVFYLVCGIVAGLTHAWLQPGSNIPLIGASGGVAGSVAAYIMLHPNVRVWELAFRVIPLRVPAALVLGLWIVTQCAMLLLPQTGAVAWWAHIGGIAAGAILVVLMRRPGVPLFDNGTAPS